MKKQGVLWLVDTDSSTLVCSSGQETRIFTIPPGGTLTPSQVLNWIGRQTSSKRGTGGDKNISPDAGAPN